MNRTADRRAFLAAVAALVGTTVSPALASTANDSHLAPDGLVSHALVLSGGGARGAYQGGLMCALARQSGLSDGQPLRPYGLVCGTSIGAINAWFVATGKYSSLRKAWSTIARENVFEIKRSYRPLMHPHQFVLERAYAASRLVSGLTTQELGIARSEPLLNWLAKHIDPKVPVLMPLVWVTTNLTTQRAEYFYRLPPSFDGRIPARMERALRITVGEHVQIREASDAILHRTLLASAAIPLVFDPVSLPMVDGRNGMYVDGSIASNAIVEFARTVARMIHIVLVDAPRRRTMYANAIAVAVGAYATMQREILEVAMRDVYEESLTNRSLHGLNLEKTVVDNSTSSDLRSLVRHLPIVDLAYVRPQTSLALELTAFEHQRALDQTFHIGERDAASGFTPYVRDTFRL